MQPTNTTELQAVNTMLSTIGEAPVDSLCGATSSGASLGDQVLEEVVRETLVQGWYFNIDKNCRLYRDGFGNIFLPANTRLSCDPRERRSVMCPARPMGVAVLELI